MSKENNDKDNLTLMQDGVTLCCGFDFGTDEKSANYCPVCGKKIIKIIKRQPTIEAAPVVHGKWVDNGERDMSGVPKPFAISCSVCGSSAGTYWMKYCPNCGAKMDGKAV